MSRHVALKVTLTFLRYYGPSKRGVLALRKVSNSLPVDTM